MLIDRHHCSHCRGLCQQFVLSWQAWLAHCLCSHTSTPTILRWLCIASAATLVQHWCSSVTIAIEGTAAAVFGSMVGQMKGLELQRMSLWLMMCQKVCMHCGGGLLRGLPVRLLQIHLVQLITAIANVWIEKCSSHGNICS